MQPANLSKGKGICFWAKGDGKTYKIMLFSQSRGMTPLMLDFIAGPQWKEYNFTFNSFGGLDGSDVLGFAFTGGPTTGAVALQIDEVEIR